MAAGVEPQHQLFKSQLFAEGKLRNVGEADLHAELFLGRRDIEEAHLTCESVLFAAGFRVHHVRKDRDLLAPKTREGVHRAGVDEAFHRPLVDLIAGHPLDEIAERGEGTVRFTLFHDGVHDAAADALNGGQAVTDGVSGRRKAVAGFVDVGRQHGQVHLPADRDIFGDLAGDVHHGCHQRGHVFHGIIAFEVSRFVGHHRVAGRMRTVERVLREVHHAVEDLVGRRLGDAAGQAARHAFLWIAVDEVGSLLLHHGFLFLAHGAAHQVAAAHGIAAQIPHDLHDLLLIHDAAVGIRKDGLQLGDQVVDALSVVFAADIVRDKAHGTRPVEGNAGDEIIHAVRLQLLHEALHAAGFELEDAVVLTGSDQLEDFRVVHFHVVEIDAFSGPGFDEVQSVLDDGQRPQAQEVHL